MTYVDATLAPLRKTGQIKIHGPAAFDGMRKAGQLTARCLDMLTEYVAPGVPTEKVDKLVHAFAMDHGALPATLMYRGYRKSTCTSLNHVVCHGIPNEKPMKEGDIVRPLTPRPPATNAPHRSSVRRSISRGSGFS